MNSNSKKSRRTNERLVTIMDCKLFRTTTGQSALGIIFKLLDESETFKWIIDTTGLPPEGFSVISQVDKLIGKNFVFTLNEQGCPVDASSLAARMAKSNRKRG